MYDYREAVKSDILDYIEENYTAEEIREELADRGEWEQRLNDDLWICDSVTGNASGSYYCNTYRAEDAINHNWDLLNDALLEFCCTDCNPIEKGAEWCDVTIRCYLLGECLAAALDELEEEHGAVIPMF
jgi:hypothetical protein